MKAQMKTEVRERPIIFSGPMVRAILEGRKTQTRRLKDLDFANECPDAWRYDGENIHGDHLFYNVHAAIVGHEPPDCIRAIKCPYGKPGDRLWVREAFLDAEDYPCHPYHCDEAPRFDYRADVPADQVNDVRWKPSIHMPREASRIMLEITNIRAERLYEITQADIRKEGGPDHHLRAMNIGTKDAEYLLDYGWFSIAWNRINGKKHPWESNPYVWVIEFQKIAPEIVTTTAANHSPTDSGT